MEIETSPTVIAKKFWKIIRIAFFMLRKGLSKSKAIVDLTSLFKNSNKLAGKAMNSLMLHQINALSCKSADDVVRFSFISSKEYEFSCSNSPAYPFHLISNTNKRNKYPVVNHRRYRYDAPTLNIAFQKALELLNHDAATGPETAAPSPLALPGFGRSPAVRQLRVTDSPFPVKESEEESVLVSKLSEEFIKKFLYGLEAPEINGCH
ncbi:hypothetical protein Ancab_016855 [Ancistrocladus abbreviatus]